MNDLHDREARWHAALLRQKALEEQLSQEGADRFRRRLQQAEQAGQASAVGGAQRLLSEGMVKLEQAIQAMIDKRMGRPHLAVRWCKLVGADVAAYLTTKVVLGSSTARSVRSVAYSLSNFIQSELQYRRFKEQAPGLFEYKLRGFRTSHYGHRNRSLSASLGHTDIDCSDLEIPPTQRIHLGVKLLDLLIGTTGLAEIVHESEMRGRQGKRTEARIRLTEETLAWIEARNAILELRHPILRPMVVPPLDWAPGVTGGYRFVLRGRFPLTRRRLRMATKGSTMQPVVYSALNAVQRTPWQVNDRMLRLVQRLMVQGGDVAGLPASDPVPLPAKPQDIDTNEEARKAWRRAAAQVKNQNAELAERRADVQAILQTAERLVEEPCIYFPHSLDFRGRIYPLPSGLSPQGNDLARSLLLFAEGKPVDASGARWLAIHGANCLGESPEGQKMSHLTLDERMEWVASNSQRIVAAADDPFQDLWWAKADDPLEFMAFCFEWANLLRANDAGEEYVCCLPVAMDGTCNGLQHFSALLQDEVGAAAVNVTAQERPQDVYQRIADHVLDALGKTSDAMGLLWLGLHQKTRIVNRKLTKRPTMTFGYGSKRYGFAKQIEEYLRQHPDAKLIGKHFTRSDDPTRARRAYRDAAIYMSELIWDALQALVSGAFLGMEWMQEVSRGITRQNKSVRWTVPCTGFEVVQAYVQTRGQKVNTILAGAQFKPTVYHKTSKINGPKQANAIAPNLIHSLDAAALMLTVEAAAAEGIEHFAMVHDSYGTLPSDCDLLARCLRQSFAKLYCQQDVLADLYQQFAAQWETPEKCPAPPAKGTLDVSQVLGSTYFFS